MSITGRYYIGLTHLYAIHVSILTHCPIGKLEKIFFPEHSAEQDVPHSKFKPQIVSPVSFLKYQFLILPD